MLQIFKLNLITLKQAKWAIAMVIIIVVALKCHLSVLTSSS